jgi:transposase
MGQVMAEALEGRDAAIWADWVQGMRQVDIAARFGLDQANVSRAVQRYAASIPAEAKDAYRERTLERLEALYHAHRQQALERPRVAAIVRGILDSEARLLGLVESKVQVQGQVDHTWVPGPTVQELLERWMAEGRILPRAELVRTDP